MKYTVKMSCGHEETVTLFGKSQEREGRIRYLEAYHICTECYKKAKAEKEAKIEKPELIRGKYWNQKIYGKEGRYCIYLGGEKILVSDEEVEELKNYLEEKKCVR